MTDVSDVAKPKRFTTKCPRCGNAGEITSMDQAPTVKCGECLMNDIEVVALEVTPA